MTNDNKKLFLVQIKEDDWRTPDDKFGNWTIIRREMCKELTPSDLEILISAIKFGNQMERNPNKNSALLAKLRSVK